MEEACFIVDLATDGAGAEIGSIRGCAGPDLDITNAHGLVLVPITSCSQASDQKLIGPFSYPCTAPRMPTVPFRESTVDRPYSTCLGKRRHYEGQQSGYAKPYRHTNQYKKQNERFTLIEKLGRPQQKELQLKRDTFDMSYCLFLSIGNGCIQDKSNQQRGQRA